MPNADKITSLEDFDDSWHGIASRLKIELTGAKKELERYWKDAQEIMDRFLDWRNEGTASMAMKDQTRWNLFWSDTRMQIAIMLGKIPKVSVDREFADAKDQIGRVAGEILERLLNCDIKYRGTSYLDTIRDGLTDFRTVGLAIGRIHYKADFEELEPEDEADDDTADEEPEPEDETKDEGVDESESEPLSQKTDEDVEVAYQYWKDTCWTPAKRWEDVRILFLKSEMSRDDLVERFAVPMAMNKYGEEDSEGNRYSQAQLRELGGALARRLPLTSKRGDRKNPPDSRAASQNDPWSRAEVWECWDKVNEEVYWYIDGYPEILDCQPDPLELPGFFPCPKPLLSNPTTTKLIPRPDWSLVKDLYNQVDNVSTRIAGLVDALEMKGVYDSTETGLARLLKAKNKEMIPVKNFLMLKEKGGIKGAYELFPLKEIAETIQYLREERKELIDALRQLTGMADIIRGQQMENGTPGEAQVKAKFASVLMQHLQNEFARWASDIQELKAHVICKMFSPETIIERSNALMMFDNPQLVMQAVQFLKENFEHQYRVTVKPDSLALDDFAQLKGEAFELISGIGDFFQKIGPIAQQSPQSLPFFLQVLEWAVARMPGAKEIEGVIQEAIQAAQQAAANPQPKPPDPTVQAKQLQAGARLKEIQMKGQIDQQRIQAETQADIVRDQSQARQEAQENATEHRDSMEEDRYRAELKIQEERARQALKPVVQPPRPPV